MHPPAELYKMVCETNETNLDIGIHAVLLPKDAGSSLQRSLSSGEGKLFVFSSMLCVISVNTWVPMFV